MNLFLKRTMVLLLPIFALLLWNCEKDDICDPATPVTPRLVISFFNAETNQPRNITNLKVLSDEFTTPDTIPVFNGTNEIKIPLNIADDSANFEFIYQSGNTNPDLIYSDEIQFNYTRTTEYVSRACGYRTIFDLNNDIALPPPFLLNGTTPLVEGSWIKNIIVENHNINSENETHLQIYF
ncbi:MAG: hypothetical protein ITG00_09105 [Flavobacterium sp.]|nr:hypothetical protein [Flavobacterium sp.]